MNAVQHWLKRIFSTASISAVFLIALISACAVNGAAQQQVPPAANNRPHFAFWYEPWNAAATFDKLGRPQVVIGVAPSVVPDIHKNQARALSYVTFYQARIGGDFLKDADDLQNVGFWDGQKFLPSAFGGENNYVLCDLSKVTHERVLAYVERMLKEKQFDGFFVDNTFAVPAAHEYCGSKVHTHVDYGLRGDDAWLGLFSEVRKKVKEISPSAIIITNPGGPADADRLGTGKLNLWDLSDYVLWESYGYSSYRGERHDWWRQSIATSFSMPVAKRQKILALSYPLDAGEAVFSFAAARIFGFEWTANLGESAVGTEKDGGHFGNFLSRIPFDLGAPVAPMEGSPASDRISRKFEHGEAIANISQSAIRISVPARVRLYVGDRISETTRKTEVMLPARTAAVYISNARK